MATRRPELVCICRIPRFQACRYQEAVKTPQTSRSSILEARVRNRVMGPMTAQEPAVGICT